MSEIEVGFTYAVFGDAPGPSIAANSDWAVLRTDQPLPLPSTPVGFNAMDLDRLASADRLPIAVVAYHADVRERRRLPLLSEGVSFAIDYAGSRRMAHTADMGRMSSGAAIVRRAASGRAVAIGVHRSGANFGEFNLAVPVMGRLEAALRSTAFGEVPVYRQQLAGR